MAFTINDVLLPRVAVEFDELPIWRDKQSFSPLEQLFGAFYNGCSFGELCLLKLDQMTRFYSAIAITNTYCVSLSRKKLLQVVENCERRRLSDRRDFMTGIEEFKDISRTILTKLIDPSVFEVHSCIKNSVICEEGTELDYIYFIKEGEFEISKVIRMNNGAQEESANQIMELAKENPEPGKITKQIKT
jgi:CRP-like cAMP-binding protein